MASKAPFKIFIKPDQEARRQKFYDSCRLFYQHIIKVAEDPKVLDDLTFVFGGDGTLLKAIRANDYRGAYILIKSGGTLGHFAEFASHEEFANFTVNGSSRLTEERHGVLELTRGSRKSLAVNEFMISNPYATVKFEVCIDGQPLSSYAASGICISTPFGSTGYSHSLGGSIILDNRGYEVNILAPIENHVFQSGLRSVFLPDESELIIHIISGKDIKVTSDMNLLEDSEECSDITLRKIPNSFKLLHVDSFSPARRLARSFARNFKSQN